MDREENTDQQTDGKYFAHDMSLVPGKGAVIKDNQIVILDFGGSGMYYVHEPFTIGTFDT